MEIHVAMRSVYFRRTHVNIKAPMFLAKDGGLSD